MFVQAVLARTTRAQVASPESADAWVNAEISEPPEPMRGMLTVQLRGGSTYRRSVPEAPCADMVSTMAVIVAMVLDALPGARTAGLGTPASEAPVASPPQAEGIVPTPLPTDSPQAERVASPSVPVPMQAGVPWGRERLRLGLALRMTRESAVAPSEPLGAGIGVDLWLSTDRVISPTLRLSGLYTQSPTEVTSSGAATFRFMALRLAHCPLRWPARSPFGARPCANFDLGELRGQGSATSSPRSQPVTWLASGVSARLEWMAHRSLAVEVEGGVVAPVHRDRFVFQPGPQVVHTIPDLAASLGFGLTGRLP